MRMLQRSVGHSHSRDSAIDTDLQVRLNHLPSSSHHGLHVDVKILVFILLLKHSVLADDVNLAWLGSSDI